MELAEKIRRAQQGDKAALNEMIRAYGGSVYQRALRKTGDRALAQQTTRRMISEMVDALNSHPDADGYDLWMWALADKCLLEMDEMGAPQQRPAIEEEVPVYTGAARLEAAPRRESGYADPERVCAQQKSIPVRRMSAPPGARDEEPAPQRIAEPEAAIEEEPKLPPRSMPERNADEPERPVRRQRTARSRSRRGGGSVRLTEFERPRGTNGLFVFLLIIVCLAMTWFVAGLMMRLGILPAIDLGYIWFNENIYLLF